MSESSSEQSPFGEGETVWTSSDSEHVPDPKYQHEGWLRHQYIGEQKSIAAIADDVGCSPTTISYWLDKHGIEKRSHGEQMSVSQRTDGVHNNPDWLATQYHGVGLSLTEMAAKADVSHSAILGAMDHYGIERRDRSEGQHKPGPWDDEDWLRTEYIEKGKPTEDIAAGYDITDTTIQERLDDFGIERRDGFSPSYLADRPYTSEEWLRTEYLTHERSTYDIADECGVDPNTIYYWLQKLDIPTRDLSEAALTRFKQDHQTIQRSQTDTEAVQETANGVELDLSFQSSTAGATYWVPYRDKDWLIEKYHDDGRIVSEIASEIGVGGTTIRWWMDKFDIERLDPAEQQRKSGPWDDEDWLRTEYIEKGNSAQQIADGHDISAATIYNRLEEFGIERRDCAGVEGGKYRDKDWLVENYHGNGRTLDDLASKAGVSKSTILRWMERNDIERRDSPKFPFN